MRRHFAVEKPWILIHPLSFFISKEVKEFHDYQANRLVSLFNNNAEPAYISRYRKEIHGGAPPELIRKAQEAYFDGLELNEKVTGAIGTILSKIVGGPEKNAVEERLLACESFEELEDIKREFATDARKSRAHLAKEYGLEKPAQDILDGKYVDHKCYLSDNLKTIKDVQTYHLILVAYMINKDPAVKKLAWEIATLRTECPMIVYSTVIPHPDMEELKNSKPFKEHKHIIGRRFDIYEIEEHIISKLIRGSEDNVLTWKVRLLSEDATRLHPFSERQVNYGMRDFFRKCVSYSINRYFIPTVEKIAKKHLKRIADDRSIVIFGKNVDVLLSTEGIRDKYVIALDPGSFVKAAFLDPEGNVLETTDFWMRGRCFEDEGVEILKKWSRQTKGKGLAVAVGNGSHSHEVQVAVSKVMGSWGAESGIHVVPEQGASKYSCTDAAREEIGEEADINHISAVSIGRRLIDPLAEYVKIPPQHLGKGQYQHSVEKELLVKKMEAIVRDKVSLIGADVNLASKQLLQNICGLNKEKAEAIIQYRKENGRFYSRNELKKVEGIDDTCFQQCAGFLTVSKERDDWCPLDKTRVHPDDYEVALGYVS
uniref:S1 motif domain-containing protein n=1 Tax=Caenorhabditis tropicalis TaxID=1561998 RepID=A0A1I7TNU3_9PELO